MARPRKNPEAPKKPRVAKPKAAEPAKTLSVISFGVSEEKYGDTTFVLSVAEKKPELKAAYVTQNSFMLDKGKAYEAGALFLNLPQGIKSKRFDMAVVTDGEIKSVHWAFKLADAVLVKKPLIAQVEKESKGWGMADLGDWVRYSK